MQVFSTTGKFVFLMCVIFSTNLYYYRITIPTIEMALFYQTISMFLEIILSLLWEDPNCKLIILPPYISRPTNMNILSVSVNYLLKIIIIFQERIDGWTRNQIIIVITLNIYLGINYWNCNCYFNFTYSLFY